MMDIKPIRNETDYDVALAEVDRLWGSPYGSPEGERLDVLITLIEAYEEKHHPILPPDPIDAITYHLENRGMTSKDLENVLGSSQLVEEVLNRKYPLSLDMIRKLNEGLGISAEILVQPYALQMT